MNLSNDTREIYQDNKTVIDNRIFIFLWLLCIIGTLSVFPYLYYLGILSPSDLTKEKFLFIAFQSAFLFGIICGIARLVLPKTDLHPFKTKNILPGIFSGLAVGSIINLLDHTLFQHSLLSGVQTPFWVGTLASIYGAINEEVMLRLFLFTVMYFFFNLISKSTHKNRWVLLWTTNIFVSILFGLGHLPTAFQLISPSIFETSRILLLNGLPGIVFGWLYWSRGLLAAMCAHFTADLLIHLFSIH